MDHVEEQILRMARAKGTHISTCPACSHLRKKNKRTPCMRITCTPDGAALYRCHHCGIEGIARDEDSKGQRQFRAHQPKPSTYSSWRSKWGM